MPAPIMCGVVSMAEAKACAGRTFSSNWTLAFLVFQSTLTDVTPLTRLSEFCTVVVQCGQCSPVIKNVAFVGSAEYSGLTRMTPRPIVPARATRAVRMLVLRELRGSEI